MVVEDESRAQNTNNSSRCFCSPVIDGIKDKNILTKTGERFGINAIGFQGIGIPSGIFFNEKNNANNFAITLSKYQMLRINNPKAIEYIDNAINNSNLDITHIKLDLLYNELDADEYLNLFDDNYEIDYKKLNAACKKYNINYYKLNKIQKENLISNLNNDNLINLMKNERRLNIILDNAKIHKSKVVEIVCDILNINLVFLPPYCPFLNPIEKVWADIKQELYKEYYESVKDIIQIFQTEFYKIVDNKSYTENWVNKFFDINFW